MSANFPGKHENRLSFTRQKFRVGESLINRTAYLFSSKTRNIAIWPERIKKLEFILSSGILEAALIFLHLLVLYPENHIFFNSIHEMFFAFLQEEFFLHEWLKFSHGQVGEWVSGGKGSL